MAVLEVTALKKNFGSFEALRGVSFSVEQGEIVGLLGPNGAGKTTTLHIILGLITPSSGDVRVFGLPLAEKRSEILQRVNFASAYTQLPQNLSVYENLMIFAKLYGIANWRAKVLSTLELLEATDLKDKVTAVLSSGQKTRVNLCKSLLNDPELLFLDEPTASLDPDIAEKVHTTLFKIRRERKVSMVYTSHNMHEVEKLCDRVIFVSRGEVVAAGAPSAVLASSGAGSLEKLFITIARNGEIRDAEKHVE